MKSIDKLTVTYHDRKVGELAMTPDSRQCAFQYDRQWLADGFSISPLDLPLKPSLFIAKTEPFWGNFGIFEDSMPDGYGRYLLNRLLRKQGIDDSSLTPIQRLSIVGKAGMGALCYVPASTPGREMPLPLLDELQQMALELFSEKSSGNEDTLYFNSGNSGGCRPKCIVNDESGSWLVKFRHLYDPEDMGAMEYRYNVVARECGINVADFKIVEGRYFASRRFDVCEGERLHVATAGALLNSSIHLPNLDYRVLLRLTGFLTQDPMAVEEMFRRMVFNVMAHNRDDHAKNFSYICRDGKWELAPAYDLTYSPAGYNGEHATSVNGNGNPSVEDMMVIGEEIRIPRRRAAGIIAQVSDCCKQLPPLAAHK